MKVPRQYPFVLLVKMGWGEGKEFGSGEGRKMKNRAWTEVEQGSNVRSLSNIIQEFTSYIKENTTLYHYKIQMLMEAMLEAVRICNASFCYYESVRCHIPQVCHLQIRISLMMEAVNTWEMSVQIYKTTGHLVPEYCNLQTSKFLMMKVVYTSERSVCIYESSYTSSCPRRL
jgi:hypothetical protein